MPQAYKYWVKIIFNNSINEINKWLEISRNYSSSLSSIKFLSNSILSLNSISSGMQSWPKSVRHIGCFRKACFEWFLLQIISGISWTSFIVTTSRNWCTIVRFWRNSYLLLLFMISIPISIFLHAAYLLCLDN